MLLLLMTACSIPGVNASKSTLALLQSSDSAMKQLKTEHVVMNSTSTSTINLGTSSSTSPTQSTAKVKMTGDIALPDQSSMQLTLNTGTANQNINITISMVMMGQQLYIQNSKGKWYQLNNTLFKGSSNNPFASSNVTGYNQLLALAQKANFTDRGIETLNGASLRHITVTFGKDALADLLNATGQNLPSSQQADINKLLSNITINKLTLDLWIDEATSYVHRMELKMGITINGGATSTTSSTGVSSGITSDSDIVIDYSKFNEPVKITAPAGATPTDNILSVFS
jgi:hypothetical protein